MHRYNRFSKFLYLYDFTIILNSGWHIHSYCLQLISKLSLITNQLNIALFDIAKSAPFLTPLKVAQRIWSLFHEYVHRNRYYLSNLQKGIFLDYVQRFLKICCTSALFRPLILVTFYICVCILLSAFSSYFAPRVANIAVVSKHFVLVL